MVDVRVIHGDMLQALPTLDAESIAACVTDPPYHLTSIVKRYGGDNAAATTAGVYGRSTSGFMGQKWDGVEAPTMTAEMGHWLAGFSDGEGCFTTRKSGAGFVCEFIIHLRADDAEILRGIHRATGIGIIRGPSERTDGGSPMIKWVVSRQDDCAKLVQLFEAFPLRAKKARDFAIWSSAVREWIRHDPGTSWDDLAAHADMLSAVKLYGAAFNASQFMFYRWFRQVFRVLKPGAHLVAFGGTRTYHRLTSAIEDAGFEIRDQLAWVYGSGFPKSHNLHGDWQGWGTALKPSWEPIVLARKPLSERTIAANVLEHGTGAINVDACRVPASDAQEGRSRHGGGVPGNGTSYELPDSRSSMPAGRWPSNLCHDGSPEVLAEFSKYGGPQHADTGTAARFFYSAKADAGDRLCSKHPTVKPVDLMRWLVRMVTPPGGTVLDPFAGSGTTGMACLAEGLNAVLIEREADYVADIKRRIVHVGGEDTPLFIGAEQRGLFE